MLGSAFSSHAYRIFMGDRPPVYLFEIAFRTVAVFLYTLILLRWMGKRGMGSLTPFEFAIIVALGSAVGDPMFYDDVPLIHAMLVITLVVALQRAMALLSKSFRFAEKALSSSPRLLVHNGVVQADGLRREDMTHEELLEELRLKGVQQLGEVRSAYLEPSGDLSVLRFVEPVAGLSVEPAPLLRQAMAGMQLSHTLCCSYCGWLRSSPTDCCGNCGRQQWTAAMESTAGSGATEVR
jgi:uncharacterized membrane protein YcaP (DUF421 family)